MKFVYHFHITNGVCPQESYSGIFQTDTAVVSMSEYRRLQEQLLKDNIFKTATKREDYSIKSLSLLSAPTPRDELNEEAFSAIEEYVNFIENKTDGETFYDKFKAILSKREKRN